MKYNELISFNDCLALQSKNYAWLFTIKNCFVCPNRSGPVFTKHFILPLIALLNSSKKKLAKSFLSKPILKAAETTFY